MSRIVITVQVDLPEGTLNHTIQDVARKVEGLVAGLQRNIYIAAQARVNFPNYGNSIHGVPNSARLICDWIKD